jgi:hypothetical protein
VSFDQLSFKTLHSNSPHRSVARIAGVLQWTWQTAGDFELLCALTANRASGVCLL